jgi:hypothetical protein
VSCNLATPQDKKIEDFHFHDRGTTEQQKTMFPTKTTGVDVSATQNLLPVTEEATASKAAQASPTTNFKFQPTQAKTKKATKKSSTTKKPKALIENNQRRRGPEEYQRPTIFEEFVENQPRRTTPWIKLTPQPRVPPGIARDKKKKKTSSEASSSSANTVTTMFSKKQRQEAAPIAAKQNAVDGQKQVQCNFSMDHKLFKKFWQLVLCRKYQDKGYGEETEAYMPPSQTFLDDEKQYNLWKELATSQGCSHTIVAQHAEYKKKLFEAFPAEFYWVKIDFSKMTKK